VEARLLKLPCPEQAVAHGIQCLLNCNGRFPFRLAQQFFREFEECRWPMRELEVSHIPHKA